MLICLVIQGEIHVPRDPLNVEVDNSSIVRYQFVFVPAWVSEFSGVLYFVLLFLKVFNCSVDVVK